MQNGTPLLPFWPRLTFYDGRSYNVHRTYTAYFQMGKLKFLKKFTDLLKIPST